MALIQTNFFSRELGMATACNVILPQPPTADTPAQPMPWMILLHPLFKSHTAWVRMTGVERYAAAHGVAIVMPGAHLSSYADMRHGGRYFSYIADELPEIMHGYFPLSEKREETFIAGCSMGGYGALKIGLSRPERFSVIGSLSSGYTSYRGYISRKDDRGISLQYLTFEETGLDEEDAETAEKARAIVRSGKNIPRIFITCGETDPLLLENSREARDFFNTFEGNPFDFQYTEHPGGHTWSFWDAHFCDFLHYAGLQPHQCYF